MPVNVLINGKPLVAAQAAPAFVNSNDSEGGLLDWLKARTSKSEFFASLVSQHQTKGSLSDKQWAAAASAKAKWDAADAAKAANSFDVDLSPIIDMFSHAKAAGLKKPKFHFQNLLISPADKYPGVLYVKQGGTYSGKVSGGKFEPSFTIKPDSNIKELLQTVAINPLQAAITHGKETGQCACCGRLLTDPKSVALGIGPVCKEKWGL